MLIKAILFMLVLFSSSSIWAAEHENLPLRGQANFKWYFLQVYEAKLWGEKIEDIYSKPLKLELKYSRSFKGKDIAEQSIKELANAKIPKEKLDQWKPILLEIFPDVNEGDVIQASYHPKEGVIFRLNSIKEIGRLTDLEFSKKFLDIWLGQNTSAPELRNKLLGNTI